MKKQIVDALFVAGTAFVVMFLVVLLTSCATTGDENRIVQPVSWHRVSQDELNAECREVGLSGCVVSRYNGDHIFTLPVCR